MSSFAHRARGSLWCSRGSNVLETHWYKRRKLACAWREGGRRDTRQRSALEARWLAEHGVRMCVGFRRFLGSALVAIAKLMVFAVFFDLMRGIWCTFALSLALLQKAHGCQPQPATSCLDEHTHVFHPMAPSTSPTGPACSDILDGLRRAPLRYAACTMHGEFEGWEVDQGLSCGRLREFFESRAQSSDLGRGLRGSVWPKWGRGRGCGAGVVERGALPPPKSDPEKRSLLQPIRHRV